MILRPYQEVGRDFLAARRVALLADEMRVGKTPQAILAAHKLGARRINVVCPAIAVEHWRREFLKWWPGESSPYLKILSYNKATTLFRVSADVSADLFIADECHFAKNPTAQRTAVVYGKGGFAWQAGATWVLSGTPAPKHAAELWPMLSAFGVTRMDYESFIRRYCYCVPGTLTPIGTKQSTIPELKELLATIMLRRKRRDVAPELPDIDFQFLEIEPVDRDDLSSIPHDDDAALLQWLEAHPNADRDDRIAVAKAKALPLVENIEFVITNQLQQQVVVFGWHVEPLENVVAGLHARGISAKLLNGSTSDRARVEIQDDFRHGRLDVVVANIQTAGTAIDLSAASHAYFLELAWVPGDNVQAANRLISMDKTEKVSVDVCTWPGSRDDRVQKVLMRRAQELALMY